jgi:vancomycin permeability regulator SanA
MLLVFPLAQMAFFGGTDYRRHADVAVVFGAKAMAGGVLSTSLEDRVRTGADLYRTGLVPRLIMSGGVDASAVDETIAMRDRAIALGVPSSAITLDNGGDNTDASVADTVPMFRRMHVRTVLAVSQFYHLPRIKLAYRAAGWDVQTVPATVSRYIDQTPLSVAREIPAFWTYWAASLLTGLRHG